MTRSPADGVNKIEREFHQKYTDYWLAAQHLNRNIPIIRGILPTNCCLPISFSEKQLEDVLNKKIVDNLDNNLGNDLDNNLGDEPPDTFLYYFQKAVGGLLSDPDSYWQTTDPNLSESFLISDGGMAGSIVNGIFVRYILDNETQEFVPASFVSNRSPVPQKVYVLNGGRGSLRPSNDNSDPVVLLMKIASVTDARELLPSKTNDNAPYIAGYPHDSNSVDISGRAWWPNTGKFGEGLHKSFSDPNWFDIFQTAGAWLETQTRLPDGKFVRTVLSTQSGDSKLGLSATVDGGGGLNESIIDSSLFTSGTNTGTENNKYIDVYNLYKLFIDNTYGLPDTVAGILSNAKNRATYLYPANPTMPIPLIYNDILDGMLPSVLAINEEPQESNLDIRVMLSKLLTFNTLLWNYFPFNDDYAHWGWNEIPVHNDNTLWKSNNTTKNIYNLLVYIPIWNPLLSATDPWDINGSQKNFWDNLSNQLEKYVDQLKSDDPNIDYINFVFATDEKYTGSVAYLKNEVLNNHDPYQITGFTSLGSTAEPPPNNFTLTTLIKLYKFTYYSNNPGSDIIFSDSFVWENN